MSDAPTVLYVASLDEATDLYDLHTHDPENGEDWGLVTHGPTHTRIHFVYTEETLVVPTNEYTELRDDYAGSEEFAPANATHEVLTMGSDAILDIKHGETPLEGVENALPSAVATVFVMQAEQGTREWPDPPAAR